MRTHGLIFPIIGNPRFSVELLLLRTSGTDRPDPSERKIRPFSAAKESRAVKPWVCCVAQATPDRGCLPAREASIHDVMADGLPRFRWSRDRFVAQLLFSS